jgi:NAD(P)-dependent dehydrogenase (short-subunit alcohol dehydrogenase family)
MEISDQVAVVTGGASGLGLGASRALAARGAKVLVVDLAEERGKEVASEIGGRFAKADVTSEAELGAAVEEAAAWGRLTVAVSCAGIGIAERTVDRAGQPHQLESFVKVIMVNLVGTFNLLRLGASAMARYDGEDRMRGVIINTASIAAFDGQIGQIAYAASKGGIVGMTLPAARDLSSAGIRVVTIAPGIMDTPLLGALPEEVRQALGQAVPFPKRLGRPEDFGQLVGAIVENDYLNGEVIRLDGALRMPPR